MGTPTHPLSWPVLRDCCSMGGNGFLHCFLFWAGVCGFFAHGSIAPWPIIIPFSSHSTPTLHLPVPAALMVTLVAQYR